MTGGGAVAVPAVADRQGKADHVSVCMLRALAPVFDAAIEYIRTVDPDKPQSNTTKKRA